MSGIKHDQDKSRVSLVFTKGLLEVGKVGTFGAKKYADHNWLKGMKWSRLLDATLRHLIAFNSGERIDEESGLSHLAHAAWNILALLTYLIMGIGEDDIWQPDNNSNPPKLSCNHPEHLIGTTLETNEKFCCQCKEILK